MDKKRKLPYKIKGKALRKKRHRIRILRLLLVIVAFAAVIGLAVALICVAFAGPETRVKNAYVKTMKLAEKHSKTITDIIGEDTIKLIREGSSTQNIELNIKETNYNDRLNGVGIDAEINKDHKKIEGSVALAVNYKDTPVFKLEGYTDNKQLMISVPQLYSKVFSMESQNIMKQYSESYLGEEIEYTDLQDFSVNVFSKDNDVEVIKVLEDFKKEFSNIYNSEFERLSNKMTYEKLPDKKEISIDGEVKKCTGYTVKANSDDVRVFVVNLLKEVRTSKKIRSLVEEYAEIQYEAVPLYQWMLENSEYIVESYYKNLDELLEKISTAEFQDTTANIYVYKGVIAQLGARSVYKAEDESFVIQILGGMNGGKKPYEDLNLSLSLQDETQMIKFAFEESTDVVDKVVTNSKVFTVGNGSENLVLDMNIINNSENGSLSGQVTITTPSGDYVTVRGNGTVEKNKKTVTVVADEIKVDYNNIYNAYFEGSYTVKPLEDKVSKPQGEMVEIFKLDKDGINQVKAEIAQNFENMASLMPAVEEVEANTETTSAPDAG